MQHKIEILTFKYGEMLVTAVGEVTQEDKDSLFVAHKFVQVGGGKVAPVGEWFRKETLVSRKSFARERDRLIEICKLAIDVGFGVTKEPERLITSRKLAEERMALLLRLQGYIEDAAIDDQIKDTTKAIASLGQEQA